MIRGNAGTDYISKTAVPAIPQKTPGKYLMALKYPLNPSPYGKFASKKRPPIEKNPQPVQKYAK